MEFINLRAQYFYLQEEIDRSIQSILQSTKFIHGEQVEEFEQKLADYVGVRNVITCSDGTAALQLIFMAYGIGEGDAIFCPDMTFIGSIEGACMLGATPIFCDIDKDSYNLSARSLERQIKEVIKEGILNPKAVVIVDFVGNPADYDTIREISERYKLLLIEDAAQGMGGSSRGIKCGAFGEVAATSFFPSKPLGCYGDGGAVFTDNDNMAKIIKSLREHGKQRDKYDNVRIGINSRLDTLQAGILLCKLDVLSEEIIKRQKIAERYRQGLTAYLKTPVIAADSISAYAQYILRTESRQQRDFIVKYLEKKKIPTIIYYPKPLHKLPVFEGYNLYGEELKEASDYADTSLGIPFSPYIQEIEQELVIEHIIEAVKKVN